MSWAKGYNQWLRLHLNEMSNSEIDELKRAKSHETSRKDLEQLSENPNWRIRAAVAGNLATESRVLVKLGADPNVAVKGQVARNPNTPGSTIDRLSRDPLFSIRQIAAQHPNISIEALVQLSRDEAFGVRYDANKRLKPIKRNNPKLRLRIEELENTLDLGIPVNVDPLDLEGLDI